MIINPSPELENFIVYGSARSTPTLLHLLHEKEIPFKKINDELLLDPTLEILQEEQILREMRDVIDGPIPFKLEIYRDIDSTNTQVFNFIDGTQLYICVAERQKAGRGRRGRRWISPFGRNVYLSIGRFMKSEISGLDGLPLVVGMRAVDVLRDIGLDGVGLKWPNDLLLEGGKLGGILIELKSREEDGIGVVIGLGINLALSTEDSSQIGQAWSALNKFTDISRNVLVGRFVSELAVAIEEFEHHGFSFFSEKWPDYNLYSGKKVKIIRGSEQYTGLDRGIDEHGNLLLETESGMQTHKSGEVSLRIVS